jgi:iron(III) transport system substrate-binding protein
MKKGLVLLLILSLYTAAGFCGGQEEVISEEASVLSGSVMVYTSMSRSVIEVVKAGFEADNPGTTIDVYRSGTSEVLAKFQAEQTAGAIQAEILSVADMSIYRNLYAEDMIYSYRPKNLDKVPAMFQHEKGAYNEVRWSGMSIIYNTNLVTTPPRNWKDFLKPEFKGKIVMPDPQYSGTVVATIGALVQARGYGWKYFEDFTANGGKLAKSNGDVGQAVASGEFALGMIVDRNAYALKTEGSPVDYVYPADGTVLLPQPIAILKNCKNLPLAKAFLDYVYSEKAMKDMADKGYTPVLPGVTEETVDFKSIKLIPTDWDYVDQNRTEMMDRFLGLFR